MPAPLQQAMLMVGGFVPACTEAVAFLARTSGLPLNYKSDYSDLICGLKTDGVLAKLDILQVYATKDSATALLNLVSSSFNSTVFGSPTFTVDRGYTGISNNVTGISPSFNPLHGGGVYVKDSAHLGVWNLTNATSTWAPIGGSFGPGQGVNPKQTDGNAGFRVNETANHTVANADARGFYVGNRPSSTTVEGYKNGANILTVSAGSTGLMDSLLYFTSFNQDNTSFGSDDQIAAVTVGAGLTATDNTNLYNRLRTWMTARGVP
jgi:hypothetical protein